MKVKLDQTVEKYLKGEIKEDKKAERVDWNPNEAKKFYDKANQMMKYNEDDLREQEPEKKFSKAPSYAKNFILFAVFVLVVLYVIVANFSKIGTEKS